MREISRCVWGKLYALAYLQRKNRNYSIFIYMANAFEERKEIIFLSSNEDNWMIRDIMEIRTATIADLAQIAAVEAECFPAAEACNERGVCGEN